MNSANVQAVLHALAQNGERRAVQIF